MVLAAGRGEDWDLFLLLPPTLLDLGRLCWWWW